VEVTLKIVAHLHRHFHRRWIAVGDDSHVSYIADRNALKHDRSAVFDAACIVEVATQNKFVGE
jgi:hypothetical protein